MSDDSDRVVYSFEKNSREQVRASLGVYEGRSVASIRVWYDADENDQNGEIVYKPSRKGITIARNKLPELRAAIEALIEAERAA